MITRIRSIIFAAAVFFLIVPSFAAAMIDTNIDEQEVAGLSAFLGDRHDYNVTVKKNGSVAVTARIVLANTTEIEKNEFVLGLPDGITGSVVGIQQILGQVCSDSISWLKNDISTTSECSEYTEPDYWNFRKDYYGKNKNNEYKKAAIDNSAGELKITLPTAIGPDKGGAVILSYYQTGQIIPGMFGEKSLKFKSIADPVAVKSISVNVSSDSDIYTSSGKSSVSSSYSSETTTLSSGNAQSTTSKSMDSLSSNIAGGYGTWFNKRGSDLIPNEEFEVTGKFSHNWLGIHWKALGIGLIILIGLIVFGVFAMRNPKKKDNVDAPESVLAAQPTANIKNLTFRESISLRELFISLIVLIIGGLPMLINVFSGGFLGNKYYYLLQYMSVALALFGAVVVLGYLIFRAVRYGLMAGVATLIFYIIWLTAGFLIFIAFFAPGSQNESYYSRNTGAPAEASVPAYATEDSTKNI